jgi:hypothetical protein
MAEKKKSGPLSPGLPYRPIGRLQRAQFGAGSRVRCVKTLPGSGIRKKNRKPAVEGKRQFGRFLFIIMFSYVISDCFDYLKLWSENTLRFVKNYSIPTTYYVRCAAQKSNCTYLTTFSSTPF